MTSIVKMSILSMKPNVLTMNGSTYQIYQADTKAIKTSLDWNAIDL